MQKSTLFIAPVQALLFFSVLTVSLPATADVTTTITGRTSTTHISLPRTIGGFYTADVMLEFDNPQKLSATCLNITADSIDATEKADIEGRMPAGSNVVVDNSFPVRVTINPPTNCGLTFENYYDIEIHTDNLSYVPYYGPYRLYKAPVGGAFHDITASVTQGSVRVRGSSGGFSEFVVVSDPSSNYIAEANLNYDALVSKITASTMSMVTRNLLLSEVISSRSSFAVGNYASAISALAPFEDDVAAASGTDIPNKWRAAPPLLDNAAGELVSSSRVVQFYLGRLNGAP